MKINLSEHIDDITREESDLLALPSDVRLSPRASELKCPNIHPLYNNQPYRIAIIGEVPGKDEIDSLKPFVGMSGRLLNDLLVMAGIIRDACFVGNVCQYRPTDNNVSLFSIGGEEFTSGLVQLEKDLIAYNPHICLLLGKTALQFANGQTSIENWRGSFFVGTMVGPFLGRKCIASYHPAYCLRDYSCTAQLMMDIQRAKKEGTTKELILPQRQLVIDLSKDEILANFQRIIDNNLPVSCDIEGWVHRVHCISFATSPTFSFIVPFVKMNRTSYWDNEDDELAIISKMADVLANTSIPKTWQNGLYDRFVLQYGFNMFIGGNQDDTMLRWWEKYCELPKGLGFQCSVLTKEPYYKGDIESEDIATFFRYCCRDSAVTFEISNALQSLLTSKQNDHYQLNHALLNPLLYMELRGICYDIPLAERRLEEVNTAINLLQAQLDKITNHGLPTNDKEKLLLLCRAKMCFKRNPRQAKKDYVKDWAWAHKLLTSDKELTPDNVGRLSNLLDLSLNIKSKNFKSYLYDTLKLPKQYIGDPPKLSTNYESLLKLQKKTPTEVVTLAIQITSLRTRSQMLEISTDNDGRIRCGYNIVGTETGRLTCYTSPTGSGYNLQTIPSDDTTKPADHPLRKGMRDLFIADEGYHLFQCDLSGADGWTVGAYMAMLGDSTMLEDLRHKLKPAAVVCYILRHGNNSLNGKSRAEIKELLKEVKKDDRDYFMCKCGIWGTCYLLGPDKLASIIAVISEGEMWLSRKEAVDFQQAIFARYRVKIWHSWMASYLKQNKNVLTATNGFSRKFFGRYNEVLGQALAHLPQVYTTYATNMSMYRLWTDHKNRIGNKLRIEPLHQVHDSLIGQFKKEDKDWAVAKIRSYFNNEITIANTKLTIPFSGEWGMNWSFNGEHGEI